MLLVMTTHTPLSPKSWVLPVEPSHILLSVFTLAWYGSANIFTILGRSETYHTPHSQNIFVPSTLLCDHKKQNKEKIWLFVSSEVCSSHFFADLIFSWIFNEFPTYVKQDTRRFISQETGNLYIAKVEPSDVGNYTCVVTNTVTKTRVQGPPAPLVLRSDGEPCFWRD